jgi:NNP family nitrate/nitrite transporter-like MFS transporter
MSTVIDRPAISTLPEVEPSTELSRPGRWIDRWEPDDEQFWETTGRKFA